MRFSQRIGIVSLFALAAGFSLAAVHAQDYRFNHKLTFVTFNQPVEIPGAVLAAGTYRFSTLDDTMAGDQGIVQISNKEGTRVFATILTIQDCQTCFGVWLPNDPPSHTVITFYKEPPANGPPALRKWVYPGNAFGYLFVYPKTQAAKIAAANHVAVPNVPDKSAKNVAPNSVGSIHSTMLTSH
jgi:hypothetical protein